MKDIFLVEYSVKGIKTLEHTVSLSFYKKTITRNMDTQRYNVKGIYGMNGSGKSGIITSADILKNILINPEYLNNPIVQRNLDETINKKINELTIEADFIARMNDKLLYYRYKFILSKSKTHKYIISYESLSKKNATSRVDNMENIFEIRHGEVVKINEMENSVFSDMVRRKTLNLLSNASICSLLYDRFFDAEPDDIVVYDSHVFYNLIVLWMFGASIHVYLDESDNHRGYSFRNILKNRDDQDIDDENAKSVFKHLIEMDDDHLSIIKTSENFVEKSMYPRFLEAVNELYEFIRIFKSDLKNIEIERKEEKDSYICSLVMVYESYKINAEFESTGIKKLIKLHTYLKEMVQGQIVFIDELDSNLHDVYLCALLEYLMEYGSGQLCFTTHNVGPMDILRQNKKSIEFLSENGNIYPWTTNGNYSPSNLYRNGMIEGSPFNVDSFDFIGAFGAGEEDEI